MTSKRECLKYIEGKNSDGDDVAGVIISTFEDRIIIGVTERNGGDSEISMGSKEVKEIIEILNSAISKVEKYKGE
ncbi:MAG: hypothetical protein Q8936_13365 [Bacillota bacterium]|nr:hypothetical protein [Bacillota bacterium]